LSTELFAPLAFPALQTAEADAAVREAVQRGYAKGLARGRRRAEVERDELIARIDADAEARSRLADARLVIALQRLEDAREALDRRVAPVLVDSERALLEASIALAAAVLGTELANAETAARTALARALGHPAATVAVVVRMPPESIAALAAAGVETPVVLVPDAELNPGDAIAELPDGLVDARIAEALDRARAALLEGAP
jgi:flagellar assembly protein FliH